MQFKLCLILIIIFCFTGIVQAQNILVIAPHPDDEIIGVGGNIYQSVKQGDQVKVVVITNGQDFFWARKLFSHQLITNLAELTKFGAQRQQETIAALKALGVPQENINFLEFPDGYLQTILLAGKLGTYTREDLISALETNILNFNPDVIYLPHLLDQHDDHWSTAVITNLILIRHNLNLKQYQYLVHFNKFPQPRKLNRNLKLKPPFRLKNEFNWVIDPLSKPVRTKKEEAVNKFITQQPIKNYLTSFIRRNELFSVVNPIEFESANKPLTNFTAIILKNEQLIANCLVQQYLTRGDITSISGYNTTQNFYLCIKFKQNLPTGVKIHLIKSEQKNLIKKYHYSISEKNNNWSRINNRLYLKINKESLKQHSVILEVRAYQGTKVVDRSGWHLIKINN